jgi:hypothetical protein
VWRFSPSNIFVIVIQMDMSRFSPSRFGLWGESIKISGVSALPFFFSSYYTSSLTYH